MKGKNTPGKIFGSLLRKYRETSDLNRFLIKGGVLYMAWRVFRKWLLLWGQYGAFTDSFSLVYLKVARFLLRLTGVPTRVDYSERKLWVEGAGQAIEIVYDCLGTSLFFTFLIFILAYPGRIKTKLWFIPMGFLLIFLLNSARMAALTVIVAHWPHLMDLYHHFVFQGFIFLAIFMMWYFFIRLSKKEHNPL